MIRQRLSAARRRDASDSTSSAAPPDIASVAERSTNALDYLGMWKLFDALTSAAFLGTRREYARGDTPQQRLWSVGATTPVKELRVTAR